MIIEFCNREFRTRGGEAVDGTRSLVHQLYPQGATVENLATGKLSWVSFTASGGYWRVVPDAQPRPAKGGSAAPAQLIEEEGQ